MKNIIKILLLATSFLGLTGCANQNINFEKMQDTAMMGEKLDSKGDVYLVRVPSQGVISDASVLLLGSAIGPAPFARELAEIMARGESEYFDLAVTGYSIDKTKRYILEAAKINKKAKRTLSKLKFLYIGYPQCNEEIKTAIEDLGAKYYFESFVEETTE